MKSILQQRVTLSDGLILGALVVHFGKLCSKEFDLALDFAQLVEHREAFFEYSTAGELKALLRQIADADASGLLAEEP